MRKKLFVGLSMVMCLCVEAASAQEKQAAPKKKAIQDHVQINETSLRWTHHSDEGGTEITLAAKNVEFNDDYTDVEHIKGDGYFRLSETRGGTSRRIEVSPGADGQLKRGYWERGEARPYGDDARRWLAQVLSNTVAGSGYDAQARAEKILKRGGANAVLTEIARLKTDYARRVYSTVLVERGNLNAAQMAKLLSHSARTIASDYEKATLLIRILKNDLTDAGVRAAFFEAANTLSSDYERGRVLTVLLKRSGVVTETLLLALKSTRAMSSDYEKANVLIHAAKTDAANESVRAAIVEAAHAISSDHERGRVLAAVAKKQL